MPKAAPDTTVQDSRASAAAMSPATAPPYVVADREPTTATACSASLAERERATAPEPDRHPAALVQVRSPDEVVHPGGPLGVSRHDEPDPARRRGLQLAHGIGGGDALREILAHLPCAACVQQARAAPSRRRARGPRRSARGGPAPQIRDSAARARRSALGHWRGRAAHAPSRTGRSAADPAAGAAAAAWPLAAGCATSSSSMPGRSTPARSATDQATRWTRTAPRRVSRPGVDLVVEASHGRLASAASARAASGRARAR